MGRGQDDGHLAKHGISFTAAARALEDPRRIEILDDRFDYGEERIQSLCMDHGEVLFVVTVMPDENTCRIISARKATRHEQEKYYQGGPLFS
ncbi:MAG: BrnT family toxin [Reyranellaceae bacterium]